MKFSEEYKNIDYHLNNQKLVLKEFATTKQGMNKEENIILNQK